MLTIDAKATTRGLDMRLSDLSDTSNIPSGPKGSDDQEIVDPIVAGDKAEEEFDPIAVGDKIAEHVAAADQARDRMDEHEKAAGALLLNVAKNHPEHLEAICDRIKLGLSRRKELLMIARGRKTVEQSRADNTARQHRHRARKRALRLPKVEPLQGGVLRSAGDRVCIELRGNDFVE